MFPYGHIQSTEIRYSIDLLILQNHSLMLTDLIDSSVIQRAIQNNRRDMLDTLPLAGC